MKTIGAALSLLLVLAIVGILAATDLHQVEIRAGGSSAVIYATTTGAASLQQSQQFHQNLEYTVEGTVQQARPDLNAK